MKCDDRRLPLGTTRVSNDYFASKGVEFMAHWRKQNPSASKFNGFLTRGALLLTAVLGTLVIVAGHYA